MSFAIQYSDKVGHLGWYEMMVGECPCYTPLPNKAARFDEAEQAEKSLGFLLAKTAKPVVVPHPWSEKDMRMEEAETHALHWEGQAAAEDRWADFLESGKVTHHNGMVESPAGYRARARSYRRVAQAIRMTAETGKTHCGCTDPPHIVTPEQQGRTPVRYR